MDETLIGETAKKYYKYTLRIVVAVALVLLVAISLLGKASICAMPLLISVLFSLLVSWAYGAAWKATAKSSPKTLTKLYLASSVFRMLLAAIVVVVYCLINRQREDILSFVCIFCIFYIVLLVFDSVYFAKVEKHTSK
ncbi:MAG: hypothetical protein LUC37_01485 [Prevotella sp.]|nr:hypothetical protein [Prevotella sp.]